MDAEALDQVHTEDLFDAISRRNMAVVLLTFNTNPGNEDGARTFGPRGPIIKMLRITLERLEVEAG